MDVEKYPREGLVGQIGPAKEGHGLGAADPAVPIQIGTLEIRLEHLHAGRRRPRHLLIRRQEGGFDSDRNLGDRTRRRIGGGERSRDPARPGGAKKMLSFSF